MAKVLNTSKRAVKVGTFFLIPGTIVEVGELPALKKKYPDFGRMIDEKLIVEVSAAAVKKVEEDLKKATLETIKAKAEDKGINADGKTKEELIAALKGK